MPLSPASANFAAARQKMVDEQLRARGIQDELLLAAMAQVPRHEFVPGRYQAQAYEDHPIPIAESQTISQPYIVAISLAALNLKPDYTVLEIGTGSGYQSAVLSEMVKQVFSIERHASLASHAAATLQRLGYCNVSIVTGDGTQGLPSAAPFDAIVVSAATEAIPLALFEQLGEGGRMVIPVGPPHAQELQLVQRHEGEPRVTVLEGCRFVPLVRG